MTVSAVIREALEQLYADGRNDARAVRSPGGFAAAEALKALVRSLPGPARTVFQITRMLGRVIR
jgi:hypothetical protein